MIARQALDRLCTLCGINLEYTDIWGERHRTSVQTKQALLKAMGIAVDSEADLQRALEEHEARPWRRLLPPVQVVRQPQSEISIAISIAATDAEQVFHWGLVLENGERHEGQFHPRELEVVEERAIGGTSFVRYAFPLPHVPDSGYHRFELKKADQQPDDAAAMSLIIAPARCYYPAALEGDGRLWGPTIQLYALRSQRNWGIGDLGDLKALLESVAELGAASVGLNPLHALFPHNPAHASPYSPSSRLFFNILYVDVEAIPDFAECAPAREAVQDPQFQARLRALRASELVNYEEVAAVKFQILELLYRHFRDRHLGSDSQRGKAFRSFQAEQGEPLRQQALFDALQEHFHGEDPSIWGWPVWPEPYRNPTSEAVAAFAADPSRRVEFYEYLQWHTALQFDALGRRSFELGLGVGLYQDLAVSVDWGGAEAWANQTLYALDARVGAPPDEFWPKGQDWGLPPLIPERLYEAAYAPFIATLRKNMHHAGALRIDHAIGLLRLYWVPAGVTPAEGAYVNYPFADLLGILALESQRNSCLVIGEDLGTVPDALREGMDPLGVLSYRLLYFEKAPEGHFKAPGEYPAQALVAVTTHDLPTFSGYWQGIDIDVRAELELFPSRQVRDEQIVARAQDQAWLLIALEREGLLPAGMSVHPISVPEITPELARAIHVYLARTPAKLMVVQLEDVFGQREQVNLPGTVDQYPNWRRKLALNLEDWLSDSRVQAFAEALRQERGIAERPSPAPALTAPIPISPRIPTATYRLQFNRDFTFNQATAIVPYLQVLGISHCYASPYLKARPGSAHGYDIIDHNALNPEIGSPDDFERLVGMLQRHGMGQILDMVPNHMGVMGSDNAWWLDVLENGQAAIHAPFFDIDWQPFKEELRGKVLLPVLGDHYGAVLENGELKLVFDSEAGTLSVFYYGHRFPIDPRQYPLILGHHLERLEARLGPEDPQALEYQSLITAFSHLPEHTETAADRVAERNRDKEIHKQHLAELCRRSPDIAWFVNENVREFNGTVGEPQSFDLLHTLLQTQPYWLAYWRVASDDINYRRFFDINDLAGLRMENEVAFEETHRLVFELLASGKLDGLRIDHPDGLYHPVQYFQRLQDRFVAATTLIEPHAQPAGTNQDKPLYVVVEKILESYERLPEHWPVHGTTGYDFANHVNALLVDLAAEAKMGHIYETFIGERIDFEELLYHCKKLIIKVALASELNVLASQLRRIAQADRHTRDFTLNGLRDTLIEVVACFPVYRTYITEGQVAAEDIRYVDWAISVARKHSQAADTSIFDFVRDVLLTMAAEGKAEEFRQTVIAFAMKFQQYTGPLMAKGLEDTCFYRYNRLVSLNEVGGDPRRFGISVSAFHHGNQERVRRWPYAMLGTSTHDSKRSEDVRARINVLSELPDDWRKGLQRWSRLNERKKRLVDGQPAPSRNDEYLLYQTLIGAWPLEELDEEGRKVFCERIQNYMLKAVKEAKAHSSWINPHAEYEEAVVVFVRALLEDPDKNRFLAEFLPLQRHVSHFGLLNSLSQCLLKFTSPGVPDIYQGTELWDFSLVDPDNRRPVDYGRREALLRELQEFTSGPAEGLAPRAASLLEHIKDGRIKFYITWKTLNLRKKYKELFQEGDYIPLNAKGAKADHVCAFARRHQYGEVIVVVPRLLVRLLGDTEAYPVGASVWDDSYVELADTQQGPYANIFTGETIMPETQGDKFYLPLAAVLAHFPVALLTRVKDTT